MRQDNSKCKAKEQHGLKSQIILKWIIFGAFFIPVAIQAFIYYIFLQPNRRLFITSAISIYEPSVFSVPLVIFIGFLLFLVTAVSFSNIFVLFGHFFISIDGLIFFLKEIK